MDLIGYFDPGTKLFYDELNGGPIDIPSITAGESIRFFMRFREIREGVPIETTPTINAIKASIGLVDQRPTAGSYIMDINGEDTAAIEWDATAAEIQTAIEGLASFSSGDVEVVERNESFIITFPNDPTTEQTFTIESNRLFPVSFARVRTYQRGGVWEHELRLTQAPVAHTATYELQAPPVPVISELRAGGSADEVVWAEIQKLFIPPTFRGTFRIVRGDLRTAPIALSDTAEEITDKLEDLADEGGTFRVTNPYDNTAYIYFEGDMEGIDQELMQIEIFDGPESDTVVTLDTSTREMADLMQSNDSLDLKLELRVQVEDPDDPGVYYWHTFLREDVTVLESADADELESSPEIDWLRPPTFTSYNPFSPSQVATGNQHYSTNVVDASTLTHVIAHNLDEDRIMVLVSENSSPGDSLVEGTDYTWVRDSADQVTITFTSAPVSPGYLVTVMSLTQNSQFDAHTHLISEVDGLQDVLDSLAARLAALELISGGTITQEESEDDPGEAARWTFPNLFEVYPNRQQVVSEAVLENGLIDLDMEPYGRAPGLLQAVHDTDETIQALPSTLPTPSASDIGTVYQNQGSTRQLIAGGRGHRSKYAYPNDYVVTDGNIWFPAARYGEKDDVVFAVVSSTSTSLIYYDASAVRDDFLPEGQKVQLLTSGTLPTGLSTGTDYYVNSPNHYAGTCVLVDANGDVVEFSDDGSGTHEITVLTENTFYPKHYERTLFEMHVNEQQFRPRKILDINFSIEVAIREANFTRAFWWLMVDIGEARGDTSPGEVGSNIDDIVWRGIPAFQQRIVLMPTSTIHRFGLKMKRNLQGGADKFTFQKRLYGALSGGPVPPNSANFALRARLGRFDIEDGVEDPKGFVVLKGLSHDNKSVVNPPEDGVAIIS